MDAAYNKSAKRLGAYSVILGALFMITGAVLKVVSGADLDLALTTGSPADYLAQLTEVRHLLVMNLSFWIVGVFFLGIGGTIMAELCDRKQTMGSIVKLCYFTGVPLAIVSFIAWLALVVQLSPEASRAELNLFEVVGWFISRADWTATILVVGAGPALISYAGRKEWVPAWLARFGILPALAGVLTAIAMFTNALTSYGYLIVPVGILWMIAAGIVLFRLSSAAGE